MARPITKTRSQATADWKKKAYDQIKFEVRKDSGFKAQLEKAMKITGENKTEFIVNAISERFNSLGIPLDNSTNLPDSTSETID